MTPISTPASVRVRHSALCILQSAICLLPVLFLACADLRPLMRADRLPSDDKLEYVIFTAIDPQAGLDFVNLPNADARADYLRWYWEKAHEPALLPHATYQERARQARGFYGMVDFVADDRVKTFIHYGPARRETFDPQVQQSETLRIVVSPAEIWTYDSIGLQLDFVKTGVPYKVVGTSRFGPNVTVPAFEEIDLGATVPAPTADARPLGLSLALYRLSQSADSVEVELQYGVPVRELARIFPPGAQPRLHVAATFSPRDKGGPATISRWVGMPQPRDTSSRELAVALDRLTLAADVYSVTLTVTTADGKSAATRTAELNLVDYVRRAQPASDVVFYSLADSSFQSPQFSRSGWPRLVPLAGARVRAGSTCYIMYELYNLGLSASGDHSIETDYDFIEDATRQMTLAATPKRFVTGPGTTARIIERVHTMNLRPGFYLVVARVKDTEPDQAISLTSRLEIVPR